MPAVTLVIPVHNDAPTLLACVRAALLEPGLDDVNVLVVDDASTDGGPAALRAAFPAELERLGSRVRAEGAGEHCEGGAGEGLSGGAKAAKPGNRADRRSAPTR
jgi:GT2 family glycosyltransferase